MKKLLLLLAIVALAAAGAFILLRRTPPAPQGGEEPTAQAARVTPPEPEFVPPPRPVLETVVSENGGETGQVVHVYPQQVLATVNGSALTLKDLAGIPQMKNSKDQAISHHMYDFLLKRAIDRELVFQAARAQGIVLSPEQVEQLARIKAEVEQHSPEVLDLTMSPERAALDLRDAEGRMLLVNMATQSGVPSPDVSPGQVQAYYEAHKSEFPELPADPAEAQGAMRAIDLQVRRKLASETMASHQAGVDTLLGQMRTSATIQVTSPESR